MPTNTFMQLLGSDHTPARLALAEAAVQAATRLRPDAAETHLARAQYLYYGLRDYAGALAELEIARRALPNDPRLFELTGYILRRRGQQEEGLRIWSARWSWTRATSLPSRPEQHRPATIGCLRCPHTAVVFDRPHRAVAADLTKERRRLCSTETHTTKLALTLVPMANRIPDERCPAALSLVVVNDCSRPSQNNPCASRGQTTADGCRRQHKLPTTNS